MKNTLFSRLLIIVLLLHLPVLSGAYSVLTHEALIDTA
jgi:hypothetical protein